MFRCEPRPRIARNCARLSTDLRRKYREPANRSIAWLIIADEKSICDERARWKRKRADRTKESGFDRSAANNVTESRKFNHLDDEERHLFVSCRSYLEYDRPQIRYVSRSEDSTILIHEGRERKEHVKERASFLRFACRGTRPPKKRKEKEENDRSSVRRDGRGGKNYRILGREEPHAYHASTTPIRIRELFVEIGIRENERSGGKVSPLWWKNEDERKRRETEGRVERAGERRNESVSSVLARISFSMFRGGHRCSGPDKPKSLRSARGTLPHSGGSDISTRRP